VPGTRRLRRGIPGSTATSKGSADVEAIKSQWLALSFEERLGHLRFTDPALLEHAYRVQQVLYNSELACFHSGVNLKYDITGQ
ncbi:unnamed protein product, partial [Polarella glacialis]